MLIPPQVEPVEPDTEDADSGAVPAVGIQVPAPLTYVVTVVSKFLANMPYQIPPDSSREMIGLYFQPGPGPGIATPTLGTLGYGITVAQYNPNYEMRYGTHGPMVRDGWTVDDGGSGATIMIITVAPDGG